MNWEEESSTWLLSILAAQCDPDSFIINTANVLG